MPQGPLILGATGQIGTALKHGASDYFDGPPIWQSRAPKDGHLLWDISNEPAPDVHCTAILSLAGSNKDGPDVLCKLAAAACDLGEKLNVPVLIASTQSVYGLADHPLSEHDPCHPINDYGKAKLEMERSISDRTNVTCLRIGNVPGADMLFRSVRRGPVALDQWPDKVGPKRSMIGLQELARVCAALFKVSDRPSILNVAQPGLVSMESLLDEAKADWHWQDAPETAVRELSLDLTLLTSLIEVPTGDPAQMVKEGRACGVIE